MQIQDFCGVRGFTKKKRNESKQWRR